MRLRRRAPLTATTAVPGAGRTWWRWLLPLVITAPMVGLGYRLGDRAFVFPEGAALAFGVLVVDKTDWVCSRWRLMVLPTVCAAVGTLLVNLPVPKVAAEVLALACSLALMQAVKGRLGPVVSASVLPVVFGITTWVYPATVAGIGLALLAMMPLRASGSGAPAAAVATRPRRWPLPALVLFFVIGAGWIVLASLVLALPQVALAPPLLVAALEWCAQGACPPRAAVRRWVVVVAAAVVGGVATWVTPAMDRGVVSAQALLASAVQLAAVAAVLAILAVTREYLYPALAIALVPTLVAPIPPWSYVVAIGVGAAALYGGATVLFGARRVLHEMFGKVARLKNTATRDVG